MARLLNGTTDYAENGAAVLTAEPITIAAWIYATTVSVDQVILSLGVSGGDDAWNLKVDAGNKIRAQARDAANSNADSTSGISINTWHHACATFKSSTSRAAFIDGGNKGTNATSRTPTGINRTSLGFRWLTTRSELFAGRIAEAAIWSVTLTDAEVASLAKGMSPLLVRPTSLEAYWPLLGNTSPEQELMSGKFSLTLTGTAKAAHPRIFGVGRH